MFGDREIVCTYIVKCFAQYVLCCGLKLLLLNLTVEYQDGNVKPVTCGLSSFSPLKCEEGTLH